MPKVGLYIHIPFCHSKCGYCDFYSLPPHRIATQGLTSRFIENIGKELALRLSEFGNPGHWNTVYIGGGTPSILNTDELNLLRSYLGSFDKTLEVTIEANPEDINSQWIDNILLNGIKRVSMGVQSFNDRELRVLGRRHNAAVSRRAITLLKNAGIDYSLDLMYGLPGQTIKNWENNLSELLDYHPAHFSAYLLSIEKGTPFYRRGLTEADEMIATQMYAHLCRQARLHGYDHYEISNFALPHKQAIHNTGYWKGTHYLGLGPGAHSYNGTTRSYNPCNLHDYNVAIETHKIPAQYEILTDADKFNETVLTSLRTAWGLKMNSLRFDSESNHREFTVSLKRHLESGDLIVLENQNLRIPENRWLVSDSIIADLLI